VTQQEEGRITVAGKGQRTGAGKIVGV